MKITSWAISAALLVAACNNTPAEPSPSRGPSAPANASDAAEPDPRLLSPKEANEQAPDVFKVKFTTTKGTFTVEAHRDWTPNGVDRFYNLVKLGFFSDIAFFRVVDGFVAQFGIHGNPAVAKAWQNAGIQDEPVKEGNKRGRLVFAKSALPNSRTTQIFVNIGDNSRSLDRMGFAAFAEIVEGMETIDALNKEYADQPTSKQGEMTRLGNAWTRQQFPNLDYVKSAEIVK